MSSRRVSVFGRLLYIYFYRYLPCKKDVNFLYINIPHIPCKRVRQISVESLSSRKIHLSLIKCSNYLSLIVTIVVCRNSVVLRFSIKFLDHRDNHCIEDSLYIIYFSFITLRILESQNGQSLVLYAEILCYENLNQICPFFPQDFGLFNRVVFVCLAV